MEPASKEEKLSTHSGWTSQTPLTTNWLAGLVPDWRLPLLSSVPHCPYPSPVTMLHFPESFSQNRIWTGFFTKRYKTNLTLFSRFYKKCLNTFLSSWNNMQTILTSFKLSKYSLFPIHCVMILKSQLICIAGVTYVCDEPSIALKWELIKTLQLYFSEQHRKSKKRNPHLFIFHGQWLIISSPPWRLPSL